MACRPGELFLTRRRVPTTRADAERERGVRTCVVPHGAQRYPTRQRLTCRFFDSDSLTAPASPDANCAFFVAGQTDSSGVDFYEARAFVVVSQRLLLRLCGGGLATRRPLLRRWTGSSAGYAACAVEGIVHSNVRRRLAARHIGLHSHERGAPFRGIVLHRGRAQARCQAAAWCQADSLDLAHGRARTAHATPYDARIQGRLASVQPVSPSTAS